MTSSLDYPYTMMGYVQINPDMKALKEVLVIGHEYLPFRQYAVTTIDDKEIYIYRGEYQEDWVVCESQEQRYGHISMAQYEQNVRDKSDRPLLEKVLKNTDWSKVDVDVAIEVVKLLQRRGKKNGK